jgi:phytoene dehydrogenase-like protein
MEATLATLTPKQKQALAIVRANPGIRPQRFAKLMWPNSECWEKRYRCGNGTHKGGGMHTAGGAYLGKLRKLRLVHLEGEWGHEGYYVSRKR